MLVAAAVRLQPVVQPGQQACQRGAGVAFRFRFGGGRRRGRCGFPGLLLGLVLTLAIAAGRGRIRAVPRARGFLGSSLEGLDRLGDPVRRRGLPPRGPPRRADEGLPGQGVGGRREPTGRTVIPSSLKVTARRSPPTSISRSAHA